MSRRFFVLMGLMFGAFFASYLLFPAPVSAKALCQCTCFDDSELTSLLRLPDLNDKTTAGCQEKVCPVAGQEQGLTQVKEETVYNSNTNRCICAFQKITQTIKYAALSPGKQECLGDCSNACGGQANVIQNQTTPKIVDAPCVPGTTADCKVGAFSVYEGVACVLQYTTQTGWPNNQKPACIVPLTPKNANIECKNYGGIAKGGTCGAIASGENPNTLLKARPFLNADGSYGVTNYTQIYGSAALSPYDDWKAALDADPNYGDPKKIPPGAGICYRLGAIYGGLPTYEGFNPAQSSAPFGVVPENDFVCLKKKTNTCGKVAPPSNIIDPQLPTKTSQFSCQRTVDYLANVKNFIFKGADYSGNKDPGFVDATCFPVTGYEDACATSPSNYRCCPQKKSGGCFLDTDCSLDNSKICQGENVLQLKAGTCVFNSVCDSKFNTVTLGGAQMTLEEAQKNSIFAAQYKAEPWKFDVRQCRAATPQEQADASICSAEISLPNVPRRCPKSGESCCKAANPKALSTCAADLAKGQGGSDTVWNDFTCIPLNEIPSFEYFTSPSGEKKLKTFDANSFLKEGYAGGNCMTDDMAKQGGGTQARCSSGKYCCYAPFIKTAQGTDYKQALLAGQAKSGEPCPKGKPEEDFVCLQKDAFGVQNDADAQSFGFPTTNAYFASLASSKYCRVTPLEDNGTPLSNKECVAQNFCCSSAFIGGLAICDPENDKCSEGTPCDPENNPKDCKKCDPELKKCVASDLYEQNLASDSCFLRAQTLGEASAKEVANVSGTDPKAFTCQTVFPETPDLGTKCLAKGCEELDAAGGAPQGTNFRCCVPGIGQSAAAAAQAAAEKVTPEELKAKAAPFTIALPPCISTGQCSLNDIVYAGASFANFLIEISGSVFLAIFVYGGFLYLTAGTSERAGKGKKMILQSTLAMVLILGAYIFISFIQNSLISSATGGAGKSTCGTTADTKNFQCTFLKSAPDDKKSQDVEVQERGCKRGQCAEPANYICCPT